jgi:hypothetical protein
MDMPRFSAAEKVKRKEFVETHLAREKVQKQGRTNLRLTMTAPYAFATAMALGHRGIPCMLREAALPHPLREHQQHVRINHM